MTILQAQTDLSNIVNALVKENTISDGAAEALKEHINKSFQAVETAFIDAQDKCRDAIGEATSIAHQSFSEIAKAVDEHYSERAAALRFIIGAPDPVEFRQAAE